MDDRIFTPSEGYPRKTQEALLFVGLIVFINAVNTGGRVLFEAGGYLTEEGLAKGAEQALRLSIVLWGALLLVTSDRIEDLQDAAERWTSKKGRPIIAAGTIAKCVSPPLR